MSQPSHIDIELIRQLFTGALDCAQFSKQFNLTANEVASRLGVLQQLGYRLEPSSGQRYLLTACPDIIISDEIRARLPDNPFANQLQVYRSTSSTNDLVKQAATHGATEGYCVLAESQTHGKGRKGRVWLSAQNRGLWFSFLLRPAWPVAQASRLTYFASVVLCRAIERCVPLTCTIKWPNDVFINNKKCAGILSEIGCRGKQLDFAVIGLGCNVLHDEQDFPPELRDKVTSLRMSGAPANFRRADLLVALLDELASLYTQPWDEIYQQWHRRCFNIGKQIQVQNEDHVVSGEMVGLEPNGNLLLKLPDGRIETINSGDVLW